jgi:hypothetical protein
MLCLVLSCVSYVAAAAWRWNISVSMITHKVGILAGEQKGYLVIQAQCSPNADTLTSALGRCCVCSCWRPCEHHMMHASGCSGSSCAACAGVLAT